MNNDIVATQWPVIESKLRGLYPSSASKNLTPEMKQLWMKMLSHRPVDAVLVVLEIMAGSSPYFPRPYEVIKELDKNRPKTVINRDVEPDEMTREEYVAKRESDLKYIRSLSKEQIRTAQRDIMNANPKMVIALSMIGPEHPGWRCLIIKYYKEGIVSYGEEIDI